MNHSLKYSFWEQQSFNPACDVAIVGAGITGLSTAYFLKKEAPQLHICVFEQGPHPSGASVKNAGFACIGSISELLANLKTMPKADVRQLVEDRYRGLELLRRVLGDDAIEYEACGGYEIFEKEEDRVRAETAIPQINELLDNLRGGETGYEKSQIGGKAAIFNPFEGGLNSGKMMRQLIQKCLNEGVKLHFNCTVGRQSDGSWLIESQKLRLQAKHIILCTNAFSQQLKPELEITPGRGYVMLSKPIENLPWKGTFHMHEGYVYFRNIGNRLLLGGFRQVAKDEETTLELAVNPAIKAHLLELAHDFLGLSKGFEIEQEWVGFMGFTTSGKPLVEKIDETNWIAAGLNGMGVALGMNLGRTAAFKLLEELNT